MHINTAPRDGRFVYAFFGTHVAAFVYFENGCWFAPENAHDENSPVHMVRPLTWLDLPTPPRKRN